MSTTEQQINLLNLEKQENIIAKDDLIIDRNSLQQAIIDSYTSIDNMTNTINQFNILIEDLEQNNLIIDDIIAKLENEIT